MQTPMRYRHQLLLALVVLCALVSLLPAQRRNVPKKRAQLPTFSSAEMEAVFYRNVFEGGGLVGQRPDDLGKPPAPAAPTGSSTPSGGASGVYAWKAIIPAAVIEDEIKALKMNVDRTVTTVTRFKSGGAKAARRDFTMLAVLFAIAGEYDGAVRWKEDAPKVRDALAHVAANCKSASDQVFNEARMRKADLQDLISGGRFGGDKQAERKTSWETVADRGPLMKRLETALDERLKPAVANENQFRSNKGQLLHEASIVAALGEVLSQEGMDDAEEEDYVAHAQNMKKAAREIVTALELDDYKRAAKAVGAVGQACSQCHADWR